MGFTTDQILTLAQAGFTAQQIAALNSTGFPQNPQPTQQMPQATAPAPMQPTQQMPIVVQPQVTAPTAPVVQPTAPAQATVPAAPTIQQPTQTATQPQATVDDVLKAVTGLTSTFQQTMLQTAVQPQPKTAEDILAEIINPPTKTIGGK